jgi:Ca2+-binding EF-hand superfamily protein
MMTLSARTIAIALVLSSGPLLAETPISDAIFARLDSDADQSISQSEIAEARGKMFLRIDRNQNGAVTADEIAAARAEIQDRAAAAGTMFANRSKRMDANRDGILSLEEFTAPPPGFTFIDRDDDGAISLPEFSKLAAFIARGLN